MKNKEAGLTLIELLTVLSTLGVLAALALPSFKLYKQKAAYSITEGTLRNARLAMQAGITSSDSDPAAVPLTVQNSPGNFSNPLANALMPGMVIPQQTKVQIYYDPTCDMAGCFSEILQVDHCSATEYTRWLRRGDGLVTHLENVSGSNCS